jgi:glycosidase
MQWDASAGAGFTSAPVQPWLPIGDNTTRNVAAQRAEANSTLAFCRTLISLRHRELGNSLTDYQPLPASTGCWAYRTGDLIIQANFTDQPQPATETGQILLASTGEPSASTLEPWQGVIGRRAGAD